MPLRPVRAVLVLALAISLTACGDDSDDAATPAVPSVTTAATAAPGAGEGRDVERGWKYHSSTLGDKVLVIRADQRPCDIRMDGQLNESAEVVEIRTVTRLVGKDCKRTDGGREMDFQLRKPLGKRILIGCDPADRTRDCRTGKKLATPAPTIAP